MAAKTQTADAMLENMTAAGNKAFKDTFEKAVAAVGDMGAFSKHNVEAMVTSMTNAGKGVEQINAAVMAYTKTAMEESIETAKKMASAKSVQELIELQTEYAKHSMDAYMGEVNKVTDLYAGVMKDAFQPLNERVSAAVEMFQAQR